jgi:dTDP-4-amino-4,6-dideoxygalactose transaminase
MSESVPFLDYSHEHQEILNDYLSAVSKIVTGGRFSLGPEVEAFENSFATFCGVRHAIAVNSGTSALVVALLAAGIGNGDEVVVPAMTFVATATAVLATGATPVVIDVEPGSFCLDARKLEEAITERTAAILPVHLYGQLADMDAINHFARNNGLTVIEDAAQAHGAIRNGVRAGAFADLGCFSFYPGKNLGGAGEGGIVTTNDDEYAVRSRQLRDWGQVKKGVFGLSGSNYRMDALQAAFLNLKLGALDRWNSARRNAAADYSKRLAADFTGLAQPVDKSHVFHIYAVLHANRDSIRDLLASQGIMTGVHYPRALHEQPALVGYRKSGDLSVAEMVARQQFSLPMFPSITHEQVRRVADAMISAIG